jgi:hypothetical protein
MAEKRMLEQEITRDRRTILLRQQRLAQLESEQQFMQLQRNRALQLHAFGEDVQRCMLERQIIRERIFQEKIMQKELEAQMMRRNLEDRTVMRQELPVAFLDPVARQRLMLGMTSQEQGVAPSQSIFNDRWIQRQEVLGGEEHAPSKYQRKRESRPQQRELRKKDGDETSDTGSEETNFEEESEDCSERT